MTFEEYWDQTRRNRRPDEPIDRVDCREAWNAAIEECAKLAENMCRLQTIDGADDAAEEIRELKAKS